MTATHEKDSHPDAHIFQTHAPLLLLSQKSLSLNKFPSMERAPHCLPNKFCPHENAQANLCWELLQFRLPHHLISGQLDSKL